MAGYVFYNGFWNPDGPPEVVRSLTAAAAARGAKWVPLPNTAVTAEFTGERRERALRVPPLQAGDYALFWDKDVRLARALEAMGVRLYNTAAAVAVCDDKAATHLELARRGVPMPRTLVAPMTYVNMDAQGDAFLRRGAETLGFPLVVKECFGSLGGQVYLARDRGQLCRLADTMGPKPFLLQQFVAASAGEDKRLYVVGGGSPPPCAAGRKRISAPTSGTAVMGRPVPPRRRRSAWPWNAPPSWARKSPGWICCNPRPVPWSAR